MKRGKGKGKTKDKSSDDQPPGGRPLHTTARFAADHEPVAVPAPHRDVTYVKKARPNACLKTKDPICR